MKLFVCIKYVPDTSEGEVKVNADGTGIDGSRFSFDINESDNYAVEESVQIKEKSGGTITIVSVGAKDSDRMIRMAMAKGCDNAIRVEDSRIATHDPMMVAKVLAGTLKGQEFDLVLTGCMANDDGAATVGVALAELLGVNHAAMVKKVDLLDGKVKVQRELEGGLLEEVEMALPAVLTIQTGINEPRYAPIRGIRESRKKELKVLSLDDLGISPDQVDATGSMVTLDSLCAHEVVSNAVVLTGDPKEKAEQLASILHKRGVI